MHLADPSQAVEKEVIINTKTRNKTAHLINALALVPPGVFPTMCTTAAVVMTPLVSAAGPPVITAAHIPAAAVMLPAAPLHVAVAVA